MEHTDTGDAEQEERFPLSGLAGKYWEAGAVKVLHMEENCLTVLGLLGAG